MIEMVIIAHNLRSAHNVGSLLRTAEGLGVRVILSGYTPYPIEHNDSRLPHLAQKIHKQISKIALGAEDQPIWKHREDVLKTIEQLRSEGFVIAALEQGGSSVALQTFKSPEKLVIIVGREVEGVEPEILKLCDLLLEIPMVGRKESFNVIQAAAMAMYHCTLVA